MEIVVNTVDETGREITLDNQDGAIQAIIHNEDGSVIKRNIEDSDSEIDVQI